MWTYYGAFYVQQHAFSTQQVGWVSLPAPAAAALMAAGWLMHGLVMVSTVVLLVGQSPAGRATTLTLYASAMNLGVALGGLALARTDYFALGLCTLALPLAAAVLVWCCRPGSEKAPA